MGKRAREVSHARVVGEEVRLLFSSSFDFASRFYISFALARFTLDADEEKTRTQPIRDENDGDTRFSYLTVRTEA